MTLTLNLSSLVVMVRTDIWKTHKIKCKKRHWSWSLNHDNLNLYEIIILKFRLLCKEFISVTFVGWKEKKSTRKYRGFVLFLRLSFWSRSVKHFLWWKITFIFTIILSYKDETPQSIANNIYLRIMFPI